MSSNFLEIVSKSFRLIMNIRNLCHWRVVYILNSWRRIRVRNISFS